MNSMLGELALAVVFKPRQDSRVFGANHEIRTAIAVNIAGRQAMRPDVAGIDFMRLPVWSFEPHNALSVSPAGEEIGLAVAVEVQYQNVSGALLVPGDDMFRPGPGDVGRMFPPGEPVSVRTALRGAGHVDPTIAVDI